MDFTNINTESQSGHSSARGRAGTEPRWQEQQSSWSTLPLLSSAMSSEGREDSQGSPVNLCPGPAMAMYL